MNKNVFADPFTTIRPMSMTQYVNAMFQLSASMSSNASPDDLRTLREIATNVKAAHEYEVQAALANAHQQLQEHKTISSNDKSIKELREQLKATQAEIQKKDHEIAQYNEHFKQRLNEKTRGLVNQLNASIAENQDLRRLFAKAVENKVKDEVDARVAKESKRQVAEQVALQVAKEVARQTQEKDWTIARLEDRIKEFGHAEDKHIKLINSIYKKNEEIKELRRKVSTLTEWKDAYQSKVLGKDDVDPKTFDPAELVAEIDKLDIQNTTLKCANEDYREEIRGYECLHGMMDKNWVEVTREKEELSSRLEKESGRLRRAMEELHECKKEYEQLKRCAAQKNEFQTKEFEKLKALYHKATSRRNY